VPDERKGADKQAKEGQRAVGQMQQPWVIRVLLRKIRYSAQSVMHSIMTTFASAPT
jgi:hypothetical protein